MYTLYVYTKHFHNVLVSFISFFTQNEYILNLLMTRLKFRERLVDFPNYLRPNILEYATAKTETLEARGLSSVTWLCWGIKFVSLYKAFRQELEH